MKCALKKGSETFVPRLAAPLSKSSMVVAVVMGSDGTLFSKCLSPLRRHFTFAAPQRRAATYLLNL